MPSGPGAPFPRIFSIMDLISSGLVGLMSFLEKLEKGLVGESLTNFLNLGSKEGSSEKENIDSRLLANISGQ